MKINIVITLFFIGLAFSSCTNYYFSGPQPVDSENIYSVPKKYTGSWLIEASEDEGTNDIDSLIIGKKHYKRIRKSQMTESKTKIELDSNIYFIDNKVYFNELGNLEGGFNYQVEDDTVLIDVIDIELIQFGEHAFLRKFDYGYILNLKHEKMHNWWGIKFIDTRNKEGIAIRELNKADLEIISDYKILHEEFDNYLIANWSKEELEDYINKGGFSDTTLFLNYNERLKN